MLEQSEFVGCAEGEVDTWGQKVRDINQAEALNDYTLAIRSRLASLVGRREVLSGRAKFGIFGDGKEVAQIALAKAFRPGDWRSGYYRDQTLLFALGLLTIQEYFAQLYAHADMIAEPASAGRQMNAHFATRLLDADGSWLPQTNTINVAADLSPVASQMPKLAGLGYASRLFRELDSLNHLTNFSNNGDEVIFGTIGNASCAEGMFWETLNAVGVLHVPVVIAIWDDDYGISVPNKYQIAKSNLSELLQGFQRAPTSTDGFDIYSVKGWDYPALVETFLKAAATARRDHIPAVIHVAEITQPQGHSTSGSQERYKPAERLNWEKEYDCLNKMRCWLIDQKFAIEAELEAIEDEARVYVEAERLAAWEAFTGEIVNERVELDGLLSAVEAQSPNQEIISEARHKLKTIRQPLRRDVLASARRVLFATRGESSPARQELAAWKQTYEAANCRRYSSHLYSESQESALNVPEIKPIYAPDAPEMPGFQVLNANFDALLARDPRVIAFGEDVGYLGGVNQGFAGLQEKYGDLRVSDTGIRELTIIGQAIGMALRGLRPIADIQYLDYLLYALQIMSDDLATLQWRTHGGQKAPVIIRTRGHRLEGIWHAGSPMSSIVNLVRGMHVLVPRNMTQATGMYNTLLCSDEPGLIVEVLNAYRLYERLPENLGEFTIPVGVVEVVREGTDLTIVTYGAMVNIALKAAEVLAQAKVDVEVIDVRSLLPFDRHGQILESLKKTNRIIFLDEDIPGGASAYMMQQVIEKQGGFYWLDTEPRTLTAQEHRPAYGSDGSYFSKPSVEDIVETAYDLMNESDPGTYPAI